MTLSYILNYFFNKKSLTIPYYFDIVRITVALDQKTILLLLVLVAHRMKKAKKKFWTPIMIINMEILIDKSENDSDARKEAEE